MKNGVFPVYENQFKINTKGREAGDENKKTIADMETFQPKINGNVIEWDAIDQKGWKRRLMTGEDLSISFELKYNFISSILREIMSKYLANLAVGINSILYNAGLMMTYSTTDPMNKALGIKSSEVIDPYIFDDWSKIDL